MDNTIEMYFVEEAKNRDLEWLVQVLKDTNMTFSEIGKYYDETFMDIFRKYIPNDRLNLLLKVEIFFKSIHNKFQQNDSTSSMSIAIGENTESNLIITYSNLNREMQEILQSSVANRSNSGGQIQPPNSSGGGGGNPDEDDDEEDEEQWICPSNNLMESPGRGTCDNLADQDHCNQSEDSRDYFENAMKRYPPQSQVNLLPDHNRFGQIAQFNCALYTLPDLDQLAEEIKIANNAKKKNAIYQKVVDKIFRQMISEYFVYSMPEHVASFVCMLCCNHYPEFAINDDPRPERHLHEKLKNKFSNYRSSIGKKTSELKLHIDSTIKKRKPPITSIVNSKSKRNQLKHQTSGQLQAPSTNNNNNINLNNLFQHELVDNNNRNNNNSQIQLNHNSHNNSLDNILLKSP